MMVNKYDAIIAQTHTAEYLMHKYWSRKPHNVISYFISNILPHGGKVLDPFCGSGVVLNEAQKLGCEAQGFDVNPVANLISEVLVSPPSYMQFEKTVYELLNGLEKEIMPFYSIDGKAIKYLVHAIEVNCAKCNKLIPYTWVESKGRRKKCPLCGGNLNFNLENLVDTRLERIYLENIKLPLVDEGKLTEQKKLSNTCLFPLNEEYNYEFVENRRILAFTNMHTRDLFTKRNFSILCHIADVFHGICDEKVKKAALLLLTASVAQCSRLIPMRNDLATGGPAWSVPGFWVPAVHLETNPIVHLKARFEKILKAIYEINSSLYPKTAKVEQISAIDGMKKYRNEGNYANLIFFDPPYGDSIPYLEFSAIWNSFLKQMPDPNLDISVSNRMAINTSWENYGKDLDKILNEITKTLAPDGKLLITFNNNDMKAWIALIKGLQRNQLICEYVTYQIPSVISSKAQFSLEGSYISDIYSVYKYSPDGVTSSDLSVITNALLKSAEARGGIIAKNLANRVIILEWLRHNIKVDLLSEKDVILNNLFTMRDGKYICKNPLSENRFDLANEAKCAAKAILKFGPCEWNELYKNIAIKYADFGFLDPSELRQYLNGHILYDKKRCVSYID